MVLYFFKMMIILQITKFIIYFRIKQKKNQKLNLIIINLAKKCLTSEKEFLASKLHIFRDWLGPQDWKFGSSGFRNMISDKPKK